MTTYGKYDYWRKYQKFFPEKFRIVSSDSINEEYWNWNGIKIHLDSIKRETSLGTVLLIHGAGGYGRFLAPLGKAILPSGFDYIAPDLPGYGLSSLNKTVSYNDWINCLLDLVEHIKEDGKPIIVFGLSIGGILAYEVAANSKNVDGLIATTLASPSTPQVTEALVSSKFYSKVGLPFLSASGKLFDKIKLPVSMFCKMERMSNNEEFNQIVLEDNLGGANWVSLKFLKTMMTYQESSPEKFNKPVLLVHPANDTWTPLEISRPFFDRIQGQKRIVTLENCGHAPIEDPGVSSLEKSINEFLRQFT